MVTFRYKNTSCFLLPSAVGKGLLAFDTGWPCSFYEYARAMKGTGYRVEQIKWTMVSNFHLDHAGLIRNFQDAGIQCLLFENQGGGIDEMKRTIAPKYGIGPKKDFYGDWSRIALVLGPAFARSNKTRVSWPKGFDSEGEDAKGEVSRITDQALRDAEAFRSIYS